MTLQHILAKCIYQSKLLLHANVEKLYRFLLFGARDFIGIKTITACQDFGKNCKEHTFWS